MLTIFCLVPSSAIPHFQKQNFYSPGHIAGFADINGDQHTDVFLIDETGSKLMLVLMDSTGTRSNIHTLVTLSSSLVDMHYAIRAIILSDFGGRGLLDVVILISDSPTAIYSAHYVDQIGNIAENSPREILQGGEFANFSHQPLLFYDDGDFIPDLMSVDNTDKRWKVWKGGENGFSGPVAADGLPLTEPNTTVYSLFFDNDFDDIADVMLMNNETKKLSFYKRKNGIIDFHEAYKEVDFPEGAIVFGPPVVGDWFLNGSTALLLAYCTSFTCDTSNSELVMLKSDDTWEDVPVEVDASTSFSWMEEGGLSDERSPLVHPPISTLRTIDLDSDNDVDLVTIVMSEGATIGALLVNKHDGENLRFSMEKHGDNSTISVVVPFDLRADGVSDFLINSGADVFVYVRVNHLLFHLYHSYVVIMTMPNCPTSGCPVPEIATRYNTEYTKPHGVPVPGVTVKSSFEIQGGEIRTKRINCISSTGFMALPVPYEVLAYISTDRVDSIISNVFDGVRQRLGFNDNGIVATTNATKTDVLSGFTIKMQQAHAIGNWSSYKTLFIIIMIALAIVMMGLASFVGLRYYKGRQASTVGFDFPKKKMSSHHIYQKFLNE